jgi:predicted RNA binding protein YcfA (HicA-like mRNA interferase family)
MYPVFCGRVEKDEAIYTPMTFNELVRLLERNGFTLVQEKGSIRYYGKPGLPRLIRVDYHGAREVPTGTCHAILKAAGLRDKG